MKKISFQVDTEIQEDIIESVLESWLKDNFNVKNYNNFNIKISEIQTIKDLDKNEN